MSKEPIIVETVADCLRHGFTVTYHCGDCRRFAPMCLEGEIEKGRGRWRPIRIALRKKCQPCGTRNVSIVVSPPSIPFSRH